MTTVLVVLSISSMVLQNGLLNTVCKKKLKTPAHVDAFNIILYAVCVLIFGALFLRETLSLYTAVIAVLFGIVTALGTLYKQLALASGPMHITLLVTTASMIIPTISGVFFGETFSLAKLCVVLVLIGCIYLSLGRQEGGAKINTKWIVYCLISFVSLGVLGVLQKVHQSSAHKDEISGFLFIAFICSSLFSLFRARHVVRTAKFEKSVLLIGAVCGLCAFAMNYINLGLSGVLPSQLFFPLINGSAIVLSSIMSVVLFREHLTARQWVGLVGGIVSLVLICLVP